MADNFKSIHLTHPIPDLAQPFDITCAPGTDIWDKPPSVHSFNAPIIYRPTTVSSFKSAKATFSANWGDQYDQGGLCIVITDSTSTCRWVKTGIECLEGEPQVSTVAKDRWSDWSLRPLLADSENGATIELENASDGSLWVWLLGKDGQRKPLREVTWWGDLEPDAECWVGVYAAKPAPHGEKNDLMVQFQDFSVEVAA